MPSCIREEVEVYESRVVASYATWSDASRALRALDKGGFPAERAVILEEGLVREVRVAGHRSVPSLALRGAARGALRGGVWGVLIGAFAMFVAPPTLPWMLPSPVLAVVLAMGLGYTAGALVGLQAVVRRLMRSGRPLALDARLRGHTYRLVVGGSSDELSTARDILREGALAGMPAVVVG